MAIDWTAVTTGHSGLTGSPEYRVENDGLVRWRGLVTLTGATFPYITLPTAARPTAAAVPIHYDWAAAERGLHITALTTLLYVAYTGPTTAGRVIDLAGFTYEGTVPPYVAPGQETGWIPVTTGLVGLTGTPEYKVDTDGLVRWRGLVTLTTTGVTYFPVPIAARPIADSVPIFVDWEAGGRQLNLVGTFELYVKNQSGRVVGMMIDLAGFTYQGTPPPFVTLPHTLANVRTGIANRLKNILGLRVYDFPSDRVEPPAAVLSLPETPYDVTLDGRSDEWTFPLWLLVAKADDKAAYNEMVPYLEAEGARSIRAAIEADRTLGGACDTCAVTRARPMFATVAGTEFLTVEFTLEVYT